MNKWISLLCIIALAAGCAQTPPKKISPSEAHQKLVNTLKEEYALDVTTKEFEDTLWMYFPLEENFLNMRVKDKGAAPSSSVASTPVAIHFLEGDFSDRQFTIRYDISPSKVYAKDPGYTLEFTEDYQAKQRNILTAISRAYADAEDGPTFFVLVAADIVRGLETRVFLHIDDLKRAYTDQTFHEEYAKRVISDQPFGDPAAIGDKTGKHVHFYNITLPEFLAKQMTFRINFKYTRSAFPPTGTPEKEILKIAAETVGAYNFTDFDGVQLRNLSDQMTHKVAQEELVQYNIKSSEGRLIHIRFQ